MDNRFKSLFGTLFGSKEGSLSGGSVREKDDIYQDSQPSRKRSSGWVEDKWFSKTPSYIFGMGFLISYFIFGFLLFLLILTIGNMIHMLSGSYAIFAFFRIRYVFRPWFSVLLWAYSSWITICLALFASGAFYYKIRHHVRKFRMAKDATNINNYENDAYILTVPEMVAKYKVVPDCGAHFDNVNASAIVAHLPISNKGINKMMIPVLEERQGRMVPVLEDQTYVDKRGNTRVKKSIKCELQSVIDEDAAIRNLCNVGVKDPRYHILHDPSKLVMFESEGITMSQYINENWYFPDYETQRPSGVYLVDDAPINVMIVAMTRGNKGQCVINNMIDIWSRQSEKVNIFVNDPKGELYTAFYATLRMRGFETVVFNLLDPAFTDQFNPLSPAIMYARKGYRDEPQNVLTNLANNFFPIPEGGEPFWTKAEQMLFNMLALVLIDLYYEEEQEFLRKYGSQLSPVVIQKRLDDMWGYVTLPNVYRMVSALATRKYVEVDSYGNQVIDPETGAPKEVEDSMLDMLFKHTIALPMSNIRRLFSNPYANFMQMADSEKMRASIYGLTLTEMAFFVEGPIVAFTNASPKKSFDLISMSFPRRFQFKFNSDFIEERGYVTNMVYFELYKDPYFKEKYEGSEFEHVTRIDELSWVEMRFEAILPEPVTYIKMVIKPRGNDSLTYGTFYAEFVKGFLKSVDGRNILKDPITGEKQIRDGIIRMGTLDENGKFVRKRPKVKLLNGSVVDVFDLTEVSYREKPLAVFSVTPPSALVYVKIVLMIIHSIFNTTVENSYMSKESGKPILKTKYMLDELGNLSYEGSGIDGYTTKLSIGLGQGQEYTSVFQTLQQITDVYGDTADRIIASNTGVTIFLLSSDIDMLETMSTQAGVHHVERFSDSSTVSVGAFMNKVEDNIGISRTLEEEPLFTVNRLLRMTNGEALVLSTTKRNNNDGSNSRQQPIFCTKETSLPMAWSLHKNGYGQRTFSMLNVPTQNTTVGVGQKLPPFETLIYKRARQASVSEIAIDKYKDAHNLTDIEFDIQMSINPDKVSREIMEMINMILDELDVARGLDEDEGMVDIPAGLDDEDFDPDEFEGIIPNQVQPSTDFEYTMEDEMKRQEFVSKNGGIGGIDGLSRGGIRDLVNSNQVTNVDVMAAKQERDLQKQEQSELKYDDGRYSQEMIQSGTFKTALSLTLGDNKSLGHLSIKQMIDNSRSSDWEYVSAHTFDSTSLSSSAISSEFTADAILFNGQVFAYLNVMENDEKEALIDDGDTSVVLGLEERVESWSIEPEFIKFLLEITNWRSNPLLSPFTQLFWQSLERNFKTDREREKNA